MCRARQYCLSLPPCGSANPISSLLLVVVSLIDTVKVTLLNDGCCVSDESGFRRRAHFASKLTVAGRVPTIKYPPVRQIIVPTTSSGSVPTSAAGPIGYAK